MLSLFEGDEALIINVPNKCPVSLMDAAATKKEERKEKETEDDKKINQ